MTTKQSIVRCGIDWNGVVREDLPWPAGYKEAWRYDPTVASSVQWARWRGTTFSRELVHEDDVPSVVKLYVTVLQ